MPASKSRGRRKLGHTFIRFNLILESSKLNPSVDLFAEALDTSLTTLYCVTGGAVNWNLVNFEKDNCIATIRCQTSDEERLCAAANFLTQLKGPSCRLQDLESSLSFHLPSDLDLDIVEYSP